MRRFCDTNVGTGMTRLMKSDDTALYCKRTKLYLEFEQTIADKYMVWYLIPRNETSYAIATCWTELEEIFQLIRERRVDKDEVFDTWPSIKILLTNSYNKNYEECALVSGSDFDTREQLWFLVSYLENRRLRSLSDVFKGRSLEAVEKVISQSLELLNEFNTNEPDLSKILWKDVKQGLKAGISLTFGSIIFDIVTDELSDTFFGTDHLDVQSFKRDFDAQTNKGAEAILKRLL